MLPLASPPPPSLARSQAKGHRWHQWARPTLEFGVAGVSARHRQHIICVPQRGLFEVALPDVVAGGVGLAPPPRLTVARFDVLNIAGLACWLAGLLAGWQAGRPNGISDSVLQAGQAHGSQLPVLQREAGNIAARVNRYRLADRQCL